MKHLSLFILLLIATAGTVSGQTTSTATYTFGADGNVASFVYNGGAIAGVTMGNAVKVGVTTSSSSGNFRASAWPTGSTTGSDVFSGSVDLNKYFGFTITPQTGYVVSIDTIKFGVGRSGTGVRQWQWRSNSDSYAAPLTNYTSLHASVVNNNGILTHPDATTAFTGNELKLGGGSFTDLDAAVEFRIYGFNSEAAGGTGGLQGPLTIIVTVTEVAVEDPTITRSVESLSGFLYTEGAGPSTSQSFEVSGLVLNPAAGDVTINGSASYEVSRDNSTFGASATISYTDGAFSDQVVYVRLKAGLTAASYNNEVIAISGGGIAENVQVLASGTVSELISIPFVNDFRTQENVDAATDLGFTLNGGTVWGGTAGGGYTRITNAGDITSPIIDFSDFETIRLSVSLTTFGGNTGQILSVGLSDDGGATYDNIAGFAVPGSYTTFTIDFNGAGLEQGRLRFFISSGTNQVRFRDLRVEKVIETSVQLTGTAGYRLLSLPVGGTYNTLLGGLWTQGFTGADTEVGSPNVFRHSNGNALVALTNQGSAYVPGFGLAVGVFADDDANTPGIQGGFPKTISVTGVENSAPVAVTPAWSGDSEWEYVLLGNPFAVTIDWAKVSKGANASDVAWVWDPTLNSGAGDFVSGNGDTGEFNGLVAPFQGFYGAYNGATSTITFSDTSKSTGGTFRGKEAPVLAVRLALRDGTRENSTWLQFAEDGTFGRDSKDAVKFAPLSSNVFQLYTKELVTNAAMDIHYLPVITETLELPLAIKTSAAGRFTLLATDIRLPEGWSLTIRDVVTETSHIVNLDSEYVFDSAATPSGDPRFTLIVEPLNTTEIGDQKSEIGFELAQNYPNPFNPSTQIRFTLQSSDVTRLTVYDVVGREVAVLVNGVMSAGAHSVTFDASNLSSGVYVYKLEAGGHVMTKRMTLVK